MLNKFSDDIAKIYETTILVNEVSQKFVDEVKDAIADNELPFQNIFGDKLRFVVPLQTDPVLFDILDAVSKIKNFAGVDLKSGEVIRKIKLDPKYGGGEKDQKVNIGRAINTLEIAEEKKKQFLNFLARYKEALAEETEFSVVISRNPIDVLRMGELYEIKRKDDMSCHAQGNMYFKCAVQEAKTGGGIAFIVKTEDIKNLSDEQLQYDEIFEDGRRNVDGIRAIARLRIRKYNIYKDNSDDLESELAIPEKRTYGDIKPNFYDTVLRFLKQRQPQMNNLSEVLRKYKNRDIGKAGGSYSDTSDYELLNRAFGVSDFPISSNLKSVDKDDEREPKYEYGENGINIDELIENMQELLEDIEDEHSFSDYGYSTYGFNVFESDEGDSVYYTAHAKIIFDDIPLGFSANSVNINKLKNYNPSSQYSWERELPPSLRSTPELALKLKEALIRTADYSDIDWDDIKNINFNAMYNSVELVLNSDNLDSTEVSDYDSLLDKLQNLDDNYDKIHKILIRALGLYGLLEGGDVDAYDEVPDKYDFNETLSNTEYDPDDDILEIEVPNLGTSDDTNFSLNLSDRIGDAIHNYIEKYYEFPTPENPNQMKFDKFFEAYIDSRMKKLYNIESISCSLITSGESDMANATIRIYFYVFNKTASDISKFIDDHVDDIRNLMKLIYLKEHKQTRTPEYNRLFSVYGKLTQLYI